MKNNIINDMKETLSSVIIAKNNLGITADHISSFIEEVEAKLTERGSFFEFSHNIEDSFGSNDERHLVYIELSKDENNRWALMYKELIDGELFMHRKLRETPFETKIKYFPKLNDFLIAYKESMELKTKYFLDTIFED